MSTAGSAVTLGFNARTKGLTSALHSAMELKDNTVIVVLGASGDLAKKKTVRHLMRST
jgi:hypothetical protein